MSIRPANATAPVTSPALPIMNDLRLATDEGRQTPRTTNFGELLARGVSTALMAGANVLGPAIPGGIALAASLSAAASAASGTTTGSTVPGAGGLTTGANSTALSPEQQLLADQEAARGRDRVFNLQYLDLQRKTQEDQRQFQVATNLLKAQHETVKTAINNLR